MKRSVKAYDTSATCFNARCYLVRDFDAARAMFADEVRLDLYNRTTRQGRTMAGTWRLALLRTARHSGARPTRAMVSANLFYAAGRLRRGTR
jgi:hypothetical protein